MEQKMISEFDIKKLVGEVMKEGLTYTAKHTSELKAENEYLKEENTDLEKELKEAKAENEKLKELLEAKTKLYENETASGPEELGLADFEEAQAENKYLKEKVRHLELKLKKSIEDEAKTRTEKVAMEMMTEAAGLPKIKFMN